MAKQIHVGSRIKQEMQNARMTVKVLTACRDLHNDYKQK